MAKDPKRRTRLGAIRVRLREIRRRKDELGLGLQEIPNVVTVVAKTHHYWIEHVFNGV
jgi:hypothetical protein